MGIWRITQIYFDLTTKLLTNISFEIIAINRKYSAYSKSMPGHFQRRSSAQLQCLQLKSLSDQQFFISSKKIISDVYFCMYKVRRAT